MNNGWKSLDFDETFSHQNQRRPQLVQRLSGQFGTSGYIQKDFEFWVKLEISLILKMFNYR